MVGVLGSNRRRVSRGIVCAGGHGELGVDSELNADMPSIGHSEARMERSVAACRVCTAYKDKSAGPNSTHLSHSTEILAQPEWEIHFKSGFGVLQSRLPV